MEELKHTTAMTSDLRARLRTPLAIFLLALAPLHAAHAWVYPEHRDIAVLAVEKLDPERRALFDRLWAEARVGHEQRLCPADADAQQGVTPACIDWAAYSAIAGDHSCSASSMLDTIENSNWILAVADVAAQPHERLSHAKAASARFESIGFPRAYK